MPVEGSRRFRRLKAETSSGDKGDENEPYHEFGYNGIKAIGKCCQMLEELTLCGHKMDGGWLAALCFCGNLKTLRLQSCKGIDLSPGPRKHLGSCLAIEGLHL
ncbi:hypothetical protein ACOSQ2_033235 [Xanthoceras sorbifolium]